MDDEIGTRDREWVEERYPAHALLRTVDAGRGLCEADFEALEEWACRLE